MQFRGLLKRDYLISRRLRHLAFRETHRDTFFAVSASLAMHIGLALILTTAAAMSASLKLGEVSIIHVSLVSMNTEGISSTSSLPDAGHQESRKDRGRIIQTATIVKPVDKQDRQESVVALVAHNVIATQSLNTPVPKDFNCLVLERKTHHQHNRTVKDKVVPLCWAIHCLERYLWLYRGIVKTPIRRIH